MSLYHSLSVHWSVFPFLMKTLVIFFLTCQIWHSMLSYFVFWFNEFKRLLGLPSWYIYKESAYQCRRHRRCGFDPWVRKIPWSRKWQLSPVLLPGKSRGQRSGWAIVHGIAKNQTQWSDSIRTHISVYLKKMPENFRKFENIWKNSKNSNFRKFEKVPENICYFLVFLF